MLNVLHVGIQGINGDDFAKMAQDKPDASGVPSSALAPYIKLQPGAVADAVELEGEVQLAHKAFDARGYLNAVVAARAAPDEATHSVAFALMVTEGPQFKMGTVTFQGLDKDTEAKLRSLWKLKMGDVYDDSYVAEFLNSSGVTRSGQRIKIHRNMAPGNVVHLTLEF